MVWGKKGMRGLEGGIREKEGRVEYVKGGDWEGMTGRDTWKGEKMEGGKGG